ncbi:MAG TPA: Gfo/Idh/MocA family oxidoreductase [Acidimicrobiia bacterium]
MNGPGAVVVGTGFGARVHVPALRAAGFTVVALVGRDRDRTRWRAERLGVPHALTALDAGLVLPGVEAVTIATPPATHCELTLAALAAGKHVLCEKPFALDATEAETMLAAAGTAGVAHLVGHEFRWATDRAVAARVIAAGAIGEPRLASLVHHVDLVADPEAGLPAWWFDSAAGGGWLGASGSHAVDQLRVWVGEIASVSAAVDTISGRSAGSADDTFTIRIRFASGADGVLQQTAGAWGPGAALSRVVGSEGTVWLDDGVAWLADRVATRALPVPDDLELPEAPGMSDDPRHRFTHLELGPYTRLAEVLRAGVEGAAPATAVPAPTFADGLACMRVLDAVRASAASGGDVISV